MPRLFVAVDTPMSLAQALLRTLPTQAGIRPVPPEQVHLTLRFLGQVDAAMSQRIELALHSVTVAPFAMRVAGVGRFRSGHGAVLWAGLEVSEPLQRLHHAVETALSDAGIAPERRAFHPHLTLARCSPGVPDDALRDWLGAHCGLSSASYPVEWLRVFESELGPRGARHICRSAVALVHARPASQPMEDRNPP